MQHTLLNYLEDRFDHDKIVQGLLLSLKSKLLHDPQIPTFLPLPITFPHRIPILIPLCLTAIQVVCHLLNLRTFSYPASAGDLSFSLFTSWETCMGPSRRDSSRGLCLKVEAFHHVPHVFVGRSLPPFLLP